MLTYTARDGTEILSTQEAFAASEEAAHLAACRTGKDKRRLTAEFKRRREVEAKLGDLAARRLAEADDPDELFPSWGDFWTSDWAGVRCYGYVEPLFDVIAAEYAAILRAAGLDPGGDPEASAWAGHVLDAAEPEVQGLVDRIRELWSRGWVQGVGYSEREPDGEHGYTHLAMITKITPAAFEAARAAGWPDVRDRGRAVGITFDHGRAAVTEPAASR